MTAELVTALVVVCSLVCLIAGAAAAVRYTKHRMHRTQALERLRAEVRAGAVNAFGTSMQGARCLQAACMCVGGESTPSQLTSTYLCEGVCVCVSGAKRDCCFKTESLMVCVFVSFVRCRKSSS